MNTNQDARKLDLIGKEDLRRRTVRAVIEQDMSKAEAARVFGVSRTSVHWWLSLYHKYGDDGLTPKRPGRPKYERRLKNVALGGSDGRLKNVAPLAALAVFGSHWELVRFPCEL